MHANKEKDIIELLKHKKYMTVLDLSETLNISASTIRRELSQLEKKGLVTRSHGGVKLSENNNSTPNFALRIHQNVLEKKIIDLFCSFPVWISYTPHYLFCLTLYFSSLALGRNPL